MSVFKQEVFVNQNFLRNKASTEMIYQKKIAIYLQLPICTLFKYNMSSEFKIQNLKGLKYLMYSGPFHTNKSSST